MVTFSFEDKVHIPAAVTDLEAFRRWARSDQFPERGRFAFLRDEVWVDLSMEQAFTHNQVKAEFSEVLRGLVKSGALGYFFFDRMFLSHPDVNLSTEPDGMFVSFGALTGERIRLLEGAHEGFVELVGTPDMVLEVVSTTSERKDTVVLRQLYWEAGVPEYWLVDARGKAPRFDVLRHGRRGYTATRKQAGWTRSEVFARSFRFSQQADPLGHPQYTLAVRG